MRFKWNYDFVKASKFFYTFSIILTILGIISLFVFKLNYGVDFRSGSNVDVTIKQGVSKEQVQNILKEAKLDNQDAVITPGSGRVNIRFPEVLTPDKETSLRQAVTKLDKDASMEINTVDTEIAKELERNALIALLVASIGIIIYVTIRFEWRFAVSAIVALLHDAFLVITVFSLFRLEVNLTFIIAVLTIVGYSINDTVVIFDRIRENMRFAKIKSHQDLHDVVNKSISQTMTRSLNTVFTVFIAALCLFIFGSESIRMFSLAMVIGLLFGAYSSIFIASPLWYALRGLGKNKKQSKATS
ncbi:protein translocase subunit SecF [Paenibacillus sp. CAA11]|uniref:protein translocase subunit SecF n=1 Tax=Paenibacillus sp. CAA11 TaxID=1532905 RepID=UPI000D34A3E7|nr:protein translocase subunit SecF [Paenibacillus sp. CAA11]AWB45694.1 protein translocase subunit SecF [Paenibacillus sp. CAA11]